MTQVGLTGPQRRVLLFIQREADATGMAPAYSDICAHLGLRSKSTVSRIVDQLVARGWLARIPNSARALTVLQRVPDVAASTDALVAALETIARRETPDPAAIATAALATHRGRT
jgi:SOS-response transcriptional repressor LexA